MMINKAIYFLAWIFAIYFTLRLILCMVGLDSGKKTLEERILLDFERGLYTLGYMGLSGIFWVLVLIWS